MISPEEDENALSTKSGDRAQRIEARRLRIRARIEEAKREAEGIRQLNEAELEALRERNRKSVQQSLASQLRLFELKKDGTDLTANVRVAFNARENQRREVEDDSSQLRFDKIEADKVASNERFFEIVKKWEKGKELRLAEELQKLLTQQTQQCDAIIEEKDKLVAEFQQELRSKDDRYVKDLKKQGDDVDLILERMDQQVTQYTNSYLEELEQIEVAFESERAALIDEQRKEWQEQLDKRREMELENLKIQQKRIHENQQALHDIRIHDSEEMNQLKNRLENEIQLLQQQMQATKATYQLNTEKLDYNYHVLKKHDEENTALRNAQKRTLSTLNNQYLQLRKKLDRAQKQSTAATQSLADDYRRITDQFHDLETKAKHFSEVDKARYRGIWKMNEEIAREKVERLLAVDRILNEQQLGREWESPSDVPTPTLLDDGRIVRAGLQSAHDLAKKVISSSSGTRLSAATGQKSSSTVTNASAVPSIASSQDVSAPPESRSKQRSIEKDGRTAAAKPSAEGLKSIPYPIVCEVLSLLAFEGRFLMDPAIDAMVLSLGPEEQLMMKLDDLFKLLFIENEDDLCKLVRYFIEEVEPAKVETLMYSEGVADTQPPTRSTMSPEQSYPPSDVASEDLVGVQRRPSLDPPGSAFDTMSPSDAGTATPAQQPQGPEYSVVPPVQARQRLVDYVQDHNTSLPAERSFWSTARLASKSTLRVDEKFWKNLSGRLSDDKIQIWKGLQTGLHSYLDVLKSRERKSQKLAAVLKQNQELHYMIQGYRQSDANWHLNHPPTMFEHTPR